MTTKHLFLICTLCVILSKLYAQDFQSVNANRIAYFSFYGNDFIFLRIDSVAYKGDSVYYPQRSLENVDYDCFSPTSPSWAGSKIIIRPNGTNIYFNRNNDSVVIKTQAALYEKWIAYHIRDSIIVEAEVTKLQSDTLLGLTDSVKTIQFRVLDANSKPLQNQLSQITLELTQHYGWKTAMNFNLFPNLTASYFPVQESRTCMLVGLSDPKVGIQNLTWFDVYDFQPGDMLHVYRNYYDCCGVSPCNHYHRRIIYNYLNRVDYPDSIVYNIEREIHNLTIQHNDTVEINGTRNTVREVIHRNPKFDKLSGEVIISENGNSIRMIFQNIGGQIEKYWEIPFGQRHNDSCWSWMIVDGGLALHYIKGLGNPDYNYDEICSGSLQQTQYYKKGTKEWGTPFDFTGVETLSVPQIIKVYPNPAYQTILIETDKQLEATTIQFFTIDGRQVLTADLCEGKQEIDVSDLTPGLYFYTIIAQREQSFSGKIVIAH